MFIPFSDAAGKTGLVEDVDFLCGTDSTSYPIADKTRNINRHYYKAVIDIFRSSSKFQWDDSNLASLPKVDVTMTNNTPEVALPALLKINKVEIKDAAGNYTVLKMVSLDEFNSSISTYSGTAGFPKMCAVVGSYIYLFPQPSSTVVTLASGLRLWIDREFDAFTTADTTQEPGIAEPFHRLLSLGAAYDWIVVNDTQEKAQGVLGQYEQLRSELRQFYGDVVRPTKISIQPHVTRRTRNFE